MKKEVKCEPGTDPHRPKEMKGPESEQIRELRAQLKSVSHWSADPTFLAFFP